MKRLASSVSETYTVSKNVSHLMFDNYFGKCGPIFKVLSPADSRGNSLCTHRDFRLTCDMLPHYLVKIENPNMLLILTMHRQQTVDMFLTLSDWLTFWSLSDDVSNIQTLLDLTWTLLHHVDFLTTIIFAPSSSFLYATVHVLYIFK